MTTCTQKGADSLLQPNEYVDACTKKGANKFNHCTKKGAQHTKIDYICTMIKPIVNKVKSNGTLVDTSTGEVLPEGTTVNVINEDLVIVHSDEYVVIDSKALIYILEHFTPVDYGRILKMANMTNGSYNILYVDRKVPHTDTTLMEELKYTRNKYADFMKRLYKGGVVYYINGVKDGVEFKHIMLNPHLARKRKTIAKDCLIYFDELVEKR
jgi:hypothetical protein